MSYKQPVSKLYLYVFDSLKRISHSFFQVEYSIQYKNIFQMHVSGFLQITHFLIFCIVVALNYFYCMVPHCPQQYLDSPSFFQLFVIYWTRIKESDIYIYSFTHIQFQVNLVVLQKSF